jgi:TRAP-type C4-dicarboxylate transport system permease small subunit
MIARIEGAALTAAQALAVGGLMILIAYAAMTLLDGLLRSLVNSPIEAVRDLGGVVVAVAVSCCFPLAYLQRSNITIDFIAMFAGRRCGRLLDAAAAILVTVVAIVIARQLFIHAGNEYRGGDSTLMLEIKTAPFWFAVAVIMSFAALTQALVALRAILTCSLVGPERVSGPEPH